MYPLQDLKQSNQFPDQPEQIAAAARIIREGGTVAFPTETVYGLGAAVFNAVAAVPLLFILARIGSRKDIMGDYKNSRLISSLVWLSFAVMLISCGFLAISYL